MKQESVRKSSHDNKFLIKYYLMFKLNNKYQHIIKFMSNYN